MKIFFVEIGQFFYFLANQGLKLISKNTFVFKSSLVANSLIAKPERVALSKM